jgi:hypothetical protein
MSKPIGMTPEEYIRSIGLDHTGRNPNHASGGAFGRVPTFVSTFLFMFYVMMGGNPFFVVLADSCPIIEHKSSTTAPADAALEALFKRGLVRPGTDKPTVIHPVHGLFGHSVIHFVQVDLAALVEKGHSLVGSKVYSLVDPRTGKSQGGKDASVHGFGAPRYLEMLKAFPKPSSSAPSASLAGFAHGGGSGGAVAASHHHGGKKTHPAPTCAHDLCTHLHDSGAGHGGIVIPYFEYHTDGSKKSGVIMGFEKKSWNFLCEKMEANDNGCWIATIARALREEGKIFLLGRLGDSNIRLGKPIGRTPVFYVKLDRSMVTHVLSCRVLNAQIAADNANPILPLCYKEIQAIGFFERVGNNLVPLDDNPSSYPIIFSGVVNSWLSS